MVWRVSQRVLVTERWKEMRGIGSERGQGRTLFMWAASAGLRLFISLRGRIIGKSVFKKDHRELVERHTFWRNDVAVIELLVCAF